MESIHIWLMWTAAMLLAMIPLSVLLIAKKVDKVRPKKRRAKIVEWSPLVAGEGILDYAELELLVICHMMADVQMRQMWGKDLNHIV